MPAMFMPKGSIIGIMSKADSATKPSESNPLWKDLSEHQRSGLSVSVEQLGTTQRTASGLLRKWVVADKRTFSTSWEGLPHLAARTVDGKLGAADVEAFRFLNTGDFWMRLREPAGTFTVYRVHFKDFSKVISKRGGYELWDIDITLEEI